MAVSDFIARTKAAIADITDPTILTSTVDISSCDREPIHTPAAIQPHGILIVLREADWHILQVSQNVGDFLGRAPKSLLNQPLSTILNEPQIQAIAQCLRSDFETVNPLQLDIKVQDQTHPFSSIIHKSEEVVILELEIEDDQKPVSFFDFYGFVKRPVSQLQQAHSLDDLCQLAVSMIQHISGFDRVMVYRFDEAGAGSVIAETKCEDMPAYLGLHYPATDIPKQAKYLYALNLLRLIPDVQYEPVPLIPAVPNDQLPLDMSLSTLRSVSPLHTEYLTNMGVRASMSISLKHNHDLWGLIACHHRTPRKLSYELRTVCEFLGQIISLELVNLQENEDADLRLNIQATQADFVEILTQSGTLKEALLQTPERLLNLVGAGGSAFYEKGEITLFGQTPTREAVSSLGDWLGERFAENVMYQTDCLTRDYPPAAQFAQTASGLLAIAISQVQQIYIVWFRPETVQTVYWAGNPNKSVELEENGQTRLSPRQSFDRWKETVHQKSRPWKPYEIEAALELRSTVIGVVLRKADDLAQLNSELARSNDELDAFAYIASHDLKEPLRGIHNYSSFLIEDYGDQLGEDGADKLQTLMRLTQRMEDLINSLLHYSRLGRADLCITSVNLNTLLHEVINVVKISKPEAVQFQIPQALPMLKCDRTQVTELFTNLITNAVKYNDKPEKQIEIGYMNAVEAEDRLPKTAPITIPASATVLYIRDNGIGIRSKHLESIFRIFKRLHSPKRFGGGTGAGLTIVKKIVERHGGQIWVDSVYGEGSVFYFTLEGGPHE